MKSIQYLFLSCLLLMVAACGNKEPNETAEKNETKQETKSSALQNGITTIEKGLKIDHAILLHADETPLSAANEVTIGEEILCRLNVSGWKAENGKVKIGAGQTIETESGDLVLDQKDLFSTLESADLEAVGEVTLKATFTEAHESLRNFIVRFKIWDKVSNAQVTGQYNIHLK